jgi:muconate cycloisomerase
MDTQFPMMDLLVEPFPIKNGYMHLPQGSGLGVEIDPDKLARYAIN